MHTDVEENQSIQLKFIKNIFTDFTVKSTEYVTPTKSPMQLQLFTEHNLDTIAVNYM
jgi:hypothetical protein